MDRLDELEKKYDARFHAVFDAIPHLKDPIKPGPDRIASAFARKKERG
jgi:hypothetical protein